MKRQLVEIRLFLYDTIEVLRSKSLKPPPSPGLYLRGRTGRVPRCRRCPGRRAWGGCSDTRSPCDSAPRLYQTWAPDIRRTQGNVEPVGLIFVELIRSGASLISEHPHGSQFELFVQMSGIWFISKVMDLCMFFIFILFILFWTNDDRIE